MANIGKMITLCRKQRGYTQDDLAKMLNCTKQAISHYETNRRRPDYETLEAIADILNVPMAFFLSDLEKKEELEKIYTTYTDTSHSNVVRIPVLGNIPAGIPLSAVEDIEGWEELSPDMLRGGKEYFALAIKGDSMMPEYRDGDVLILRKQDSCETGDDCAVMVNGDDATFKRVRRSEKGITLQPLNPAYDPMFFSNEEIMSLPVRIIGVVVEIRRKIRK